jgi:thiamine-monophosphate kinase
LPGDVVFVTGPCGASAAGLRVLRAGRAGGAGGADGPGQVPLAAAYRRPRARLAEGEAARLAGAHAMIDVSDGLALDLHRLADASGVGFVVDAVPTAAGATRTEALGGGEDYELVVAIGPADVEGYRERCAASGLRSPFRIGVVVADQADRRLGDDPLGRLGWQHAVG